MGSVAANGTSPSLPRFAAHFQAVRPTFLNAEVRYNPMESTDVFEGLPEKLLRFVTQYEGQLGVPAGFILGLLVEADDWSFVLKLHGVLEGALNKKLLELIGRPALEQPFRRLQMRTMISFAEALEAMSGKSVSFLEGLGELRNQLVHDVSNVAFDL